ncbi:MAG: hypothetical protein U0T77_03890 [Chitinophagales bacterium]
MKTTQMNDIRLMNADLYRLIANCFDYPDKESLLNIREMANGLYNAGYPDESINNMFNRWLNLQLKKTCCMLYRYFCKRWCCAK